MSTTTHGNELEAEQNADTDAADSETDTGAERPLSLSCPACGRHLGVDTNGWPETCPATRCGRVVRPEEVLGL